jgi:hypothetical protein
MRCHFRLFARQWRLIGGQCCLILTSFCLVGGRFPSDLPFCGLGTAPRAFGNGIKSDGNGINSYGIGTKSDGEAGQSYGKEGVADDAKLRSGGIRPSADGVKAKCYGVAGNSDGAGLRRIAYGSRW